MFQFKSGGQYFPWASVKSHDASKKLPQSTNTEPFGWRNFKNETHMSHKEKGLLRNLFKQLHGVPSTQWRKVYGVPDMILSPKVNITKKAMGVFSGIKKVGLIFKYKSGFRVFQFNGNSGQFFKFRIRKGGGSSRRLRIGP